MKKILLLVAVMAALLLPSCAAGPHQLQRTVDDWDHELYVDSPLLNGVLYVIPVIPIAKYAAAIGDFLIVDAYSFWIEDLWDGKGTGFQHYEVTPTDGQLGSLLIDDAGFLSKQ
ncbi:MAG: hypothetical protein D6702_01195 [Planctomycetota bacterium]|nr:MAG: hypothetical protein D6702_01195 [Planctomycetota bacterium]